MMEDGGEAAERAAGEDIGTWSLFVVVDRSIPRSGVDPSETKKRADGFNEITSTELTTSSYVFTKGENGSVTVGN
jgi:hypothetical protein